MGWRKPAGAGSAPSSRGFWHGEASPPTLGWSGPGNVHFLRTPGVWKLGLRPSETYFSPCPAGNNTWARRAEARKHFNHVRFWRKVLIAAASCGTRCLGQVKLTSQVADADLKGVYFLLWEQQCLRLRSPVGASWCLRLLRCRLVRYLHPTHWVLNVNHGNRHATAMANTDSCRRIDVGSCCRRLCEWRAALDSSAPCRAPLATTGALPT